jgi:hypothetical protein
METQCGKIVLFEEYTFRVNLATAEELRADLPLRTVATAEDGVIYELDSSAKAAAPSRSDALGGPAQVDE